jgi:isocitrate/isopropylmalate dehydrogenase
VRPPTGDASVVAVAGSNLFGDTLSDLESALAGTLCIPANANLDPDPQPVVSA